MSQQRSFSPAIVVVSSAFIRELLEDVSAAIENLESAEGSMTTGLYTISVDALDSALASLERVKRALERRENTDREEKDTGCYFLQI